MKKLAVSLVALGAMTSVALAEPAKLSDTQLDQVTAGGPLADLFRPIIAGALVGLGGGGDLQFQIAFINAAIALSDFLNSFVPAENGTASVASFRSFVPTLPEGATLTISSATLP